MYRYKESGLDDVMLENGCTIRQTPYGETVTIENVDALHRLLGSRIILQREITGAELRFLRREMGKTQAELAALFRMTEQTVSLWERDRTKAIPPLADSLLRLLYIGHIRPKSPIRTSAWLKRTAQAADRIEKSVRLTPTHHWKAIEAHA